MHLNSDLDWAKGREKEEREEEKRRGKTRDKNNKEPPELPLKEQQELQ